MMAHCHGVVNRRISDEIEAATDENKKELLKAVRINFSINSKLSYVILWLYFVVFVCFWSLFYIFIMLF